MPLTHRKIVDRQVNPVGLGCMSLSWAYGTPPSDAEGARLLERALDIGYDHLDTARIYGLGHNETLIGKTLAAHRDRFLLASKTGIIVDGDKRRIDCRPETIRTALETSLQAAEDRPDRPLLPPPPRFHRADRGIRSGRSPSWWPRARSAVSASARCRPRRCAASAVHPIAAMQTEYSPMTRNPEIAVLEACRELGTTFVAFSPVGRGMLAGGAITGPRN